MYTIHKFNLSHIVFETTSLCNLNCKYCYNVWKRPGQNIVKLNSYRKSIKTLKKLFSKVNLTQITMSGGEPFLSERFSELVLFCRMKGKKVTIITNGNYAKKTDYKQMLELGVGLFQVPLHSFEPGPHDFLAGVSGAFSNAVESVKTILSLGGKLVCVIVITKANYKQIKKTLLYINELGIKRIMLNRFNIGGMGIKEQKNLLLTHKELKQVYNIANETGIKYNLKLTSNVCTPLCVINPKDYPGIGMSSCAAKVINMPLTLDSIGNLRLCNHSPVVIGNIFKDKIMNIFNSKYCKSWKEFIPEYCIDCKDYSKCLGGCRAASEQLWNTNKIVDPLVTMK